MPSRRRPIRLRDKAENCYTMVVYTKTLGGDGEVKNILMYDTEAESIKLWW